MSIKIIAQNKKARFDFEILDTMEAGLVLMGSEVKSLRDGACNLKDSYISFRGDEAFLQSAHISEYKPSSYNNHHPERLRKVLLHRHQLNQLMGSIHEKGLTCVPLKLYFKKGVVKLEIGLGKGKKQHDKRQSLKKRDVAKALRQVTRHSK